MPKNKGQHKDSSTKTAKEAAKVAKDSLPKHSPPSKGPGSKSGKNK